MKTETYARVWLSHATLLATALVALSSLTGNVIRLSGDGPACPDWPLCFGSVLPVDNGRALAEGVHRLLAALTGLVALGAAVLAWRSHLFGSAAGRALARAIGLLLAQAAVGAAITLSGWDAHWTALHLTLGLLALGAVLGAHIEVTVPPLPAQGEAPAVARFRRALKALAGVMFLLMLSGVLVSGNGAALACGQGFPLCNGGWLPNGGRLTFLQWLHRVMVFVAGAFLLWTLRQAFRRGADVPPSLRAALGAMAVLYAAQGALGAAMVALNRPAVMASAHNALSSALWLAAVAAAMLGGRLPLRLPEPAPRPSPAWLAPVRDYLALTKPKVVSLLLFTTLAGMFLTPAGLPPWELVLWTMLGGYLMAGGANAVNMAYDADIDGAMGRTARRPTVAGRISPRRAYAFGIGLALASLVIFAAFVNWLAAALAGVGFFYYTVIYTRWLKRSSWQNIVIGGGAGAIPPMIGWAAASNRLDLAAFLLFALVFYWTPPHFWALALMKREDYAAAGVPMLPVVAGEAETARQMLWYALGTVALSLLLAPLGVVGDVYLALAAALGARLVWLTWKVNRNPDRRAALQLYVYSLVYLFALFGAMVLDRAVRWLS